MKILFLGDFFFDYETEPDDFKEICNYVKDKNYRVILNLESSLSDIGKPIKKRGPNLCSSKTAIQALKDLRVVAVTLSNNHTMDFGGSSLAETIEKLDEAGIKHLGAGRNVSEALEAVEIDGDGQNVILTNYGWDVEETIYATEKSAGCAPLLRKEIVKRTKRIKEKNPDAIIIHLFHWGFEYNTFPMPVDIELARNCCDEGCDIVIGTHPHVVQPVERYKNSRIYYSLGNFYFGSRRSAFRRVFPLEQEKLYSNIGAGVVFDTETNEFIDLQITYVPKMDKTIMEERKAVLPDISGINPRQVKYIRNVKKHAQNCNPILTGNRVMDPIKIRTLYTVYKIYGCLKRWMRKGKWTIIIKGE